MNYSDEDAQLNAAILESMRMMQGPSQAVPTATMGYGQDNLELDTVLSRMDRYKYEIETLDAKLQALVIQYNQAEREYETIAGRLGITALQSPPRTDTFKIMQDRQLMQEQNAAYEESLRRDRPSIPSVAPVRKMPTLAPSYNTGSAVPVMRTSTGAPKVPKMPTRNPQVTKLMNPRSDNTKVQIKADMNLSGNKKTVNVTTDGAETIGNLVAYFKFLNKGSPIVITSPGLNLGRCSAQTSLRECGITGRIRITVADE